MTRRGSRLEPRVGAASIAGAALAAAFALIVLIVSIQVSVAGAFRGTRPQIALAWAPYDAQARARLAVSLIENRASPAARERAIRFSQEAIRRDPIAPAALRALATTIESTDPTRQEQAFALISASQRLSRRDQATQIWLIEHYIREGRPDEAMQHFDIALRTSAPSRQVLFPLLTSTLADEPLFDALAARLRRKPDWTLPFLTYLVDHDNTPAQTSRLVREFLDPRTPEEFEVIATHVERLTASGEYALAWRAYTRFGLAGAGATTAGALKNGDFERATGIQPFAWWYAEEPDLWAAPEPDPQGRGNVLQVAAISGRTGEVARQLVRLAPGRYRLRAEFGDVPADAFERPELRVDCARRGARPNLARLRPASSGAARRAATGTFEIPAGCSFQWVSIAVAGDDSEGGPRPWVDSIELFPIGGRS